MNIYIFKALHYIYFDCLIGRVSLSWVTRYTLLISSFR